MKSGNRPLNVILIVSDEHQAAACGCYGSAVRRRDGTSPTPHIDALAREGVRFDSMYCPSPLCAPSRAAYMTGRHPHTTTAIHHKMQGREAGLTRFPGVAGGMRAIGDYFREAGHRTAAIGKMHIHGELTDGWDLGFDLRKLRFYTEFPGSHYNELLGGDPNLRYRELPPYLDRRYRDIDPVRFAAAPDRLTVRDNDLNQHFLETLVEREEEMEDFLVARESIRFIRECAGQGRPFMIHVGFEKPHRPWTIQQRFLDLFDPAAMPLPQTTAEWLERGMIPTVQKWCHTPVRGDQARNSIAAYHACAAAVDEYVGDIVRACRDLGILDDTLVIYASDHGESLYEHGLIEKHNMLEPSVRVPMVARLPGRLPAGAVHDAPASLVDLVPTLCELAGLRAEPGVEGESLMRIVEGRADPGRLVYSEFHSTGNATWPEDFTPVRMVLDSHYKYVYTHAVIDQLYDRSADPREDHNLALDPAHEPRLSRMRLLALADWELDEYPRLDAGAAVADGSVLLSWEHPGNPARFDIYRGPDADPRSAARVAREVDALEWRDTAPPAAGSPCTYWVVARELLEREFTDPNGKRRYGGLPVAARNHPMLLPVTEPVSIRIESGFSADFTFRPLLGFQLAGQHWFHIGHPPVVEGDTARFTGASTVLSPRVIEGPHCISACLRSCPADPLAGEAAALLFRYRNMNRCYSVSLLPGGTVRLLRKAGQNAETVAESPATTLDPQREHRFEASVNQGRIEVRIDGHKVIDHIDPHPLPAGRAGFDGGLSLREFAFRKAAIQPASFFSI
jgi:arylsulfatase A-like enzyme